MLDCYPSEFVQVIFESQQQTFWKRETVFIRWVAFSPDDPFCYKQIAKLSSRFRIVGKVFLLNYKQTDIIYI